MSFVNPSSEKDYGDITITAVDTSNPAGYLDIGTVKYFRTCILFDFSLFFAYSFKNLITDDDNLDLGFKISLYRLFNELNSKLINMLPEYQKNDYSINDKHSDSELGFAVGMTYRLENFYIPMKKGLILIKKLKSIIRSGGCLINGLLEFF